MIFDPLFLAIATTAFATALTLKIKQINRERATQRNIKKAIEQAMIARARRNAYAGKV